jgi:hypothetical protein
MRVALVKNTSVEYWRAELLEAGYDTKWKEYTVRDLPEKLLRDMAKSGLPLSVMTDGLPESSRLPAGGYSAPQLVNEDELFARLQKQYADEAKIKIAWTKRETFTNNSLCTEFDAAGFDSGKWFQSEVRELPVSLTRLLIANEAEGFTTDAEKIGEYELLNQRKFSEPQKTMREQREAHRKARQAEQLKQYGEMQQREAVREKIQKKLGLTDAEYLAQFG